MEMITCHAFLGGTKEVERERLTFRPAAYGLVIEGTKNLLVNTKLTGRY